MGVGLRKPVQLVHYVVEKDANGRNKETEGLTYNAWAEISDPTGFRDYDNGQTQLGSTKRFLIRFRFENAPDGEWKMKYDGKLWMISERRKVEEKRFYWLIVATQKSNV